MKHHHKYRIVPDQPNQAQGRRIHHIDGVPMLREEIWLRARCKCGSEVYKVYQFRGYEVNE